MRNGTTRFGLLALLALFACQHGAGRGLRLEGCPGVLRPTEEIAGDFRLEQRVHIRAKSGEIALRIVAEKRGPTLVVIGLNPLGVKLFSVIQTKRKVQVDALPARVVPIPPIDVLHDLHRARFLDAGVAPDASGRAEGIRDGTRIVETWRDGVLRQRRFSRVEGLPSGEVIVDFAVPAPNESPRVQIRNDGCGYSASFETLAWETLR